MNEAACVAAFLVVFSQPALAAERLVTDSFEITIEVRCAEATNNGSCDAVWFRWRAPCF